MTKITKWCGKTITLEEAKAIMSEYDEIFAFKDEEDFETFNSVDPIKLDSVDYFLFNLKYKLINCVKQIGEFDYDDIVFIFEDAED